MLKGEGCEAFLVTAIRGCKLRYGRFCVLFGVFWPWNPHLGMCRAEAGTTERIGLVSLKGVDI